MNDQEKERAFEMHLREVLHQRGGLAQEAES